MAEPIFSLQDPHDLHMWHGAITENVVQFFGRLAVPSAIIPTLPSHRASMQLQSAVQAGPASQRSAR